jgi:HD-GYP domain-containing protein (c-di-GMP phosphodiesterase class II)
VLGIAAFLSLFLPACFFAASYLPLAPRLERVLPFWPVGWLLAVAAGIVLAFGAYALGNSEMVAESPWSRPPATYLLAGVTILLLLYSASRQLRLYRLGRRSAQVALAAAYLLLAEAQLAMVASTPWTAAWWGYHLLMLAGVGVALRALMVERAAGRPLRKILESTLQLEITVGAEIQNVQTVAALAAAVEVKDRETQGHNVRVADYAVGIGRELGLPAAQLRTLARGALLHDVGKLGVPDAILHKAGALSAEEWAVIRRHPEIGADILRRAGGFSSELEAVLHHHERVDGSGYPHGLRGEGIPLTARIVAVADTFDVLTSDRAYRRGRSRDEALAVIREECGAHLDERVVNAFLRSLETLRGLPMAASA